MSKTSTSSTSSTHIHSNKENIEENVYIHKDMEDAKKHNFNFHFLTSVVIYPLICGSVFGLAFQLGHIQEFFFIKRQMELIPTSEGSIFPYTFASVTMLKMFLGAAFVSIFLLNMLSKLYPNKYNNITAWATTEPFRGYLSACTGTFLVGMGMYITGSCPGTVYAQIGNGSKKAMANWLGGLLGAGIFGLLDSYIPQQLQAFCDIGKPKSSRSMLSQILGISRDATVYGIMTFLAAILYTVESFYPWKEELKTMYLNSTDDPKLQFRWQETNFQYEIIPVFAGLMIGALQLPLFYFTNITLGTSTTYPTVLANLLPNWTSSCHINACRTYYWQSFLVLGIVIASYLYGVFTGNWFVGDDLVSWSNAIIGGIIFGFGSRIGGGCTSGHGISGFGMLSNVSIAGTCMMFAGAMVTAAVIG